MTKLRVLLCLTFFFLCMAGCRPSVTIESPEEGASFDQEKEITFSGYANDFEDGELSGTSLIWTSDRDGQSGIGSTFAYAGLHSGQHTITLTATDADGEQDDDSVTIMVLAATSDNATGSGRRERLMNAKTWMYQISLLDEDKAVEVLAATEYPLLILEPGHNHRPCDDFDPADFGIPQKNRDDACANVYKTREMIDALRTTPAGAERLLIAYIDIGQAEWYRDYWKEGWSPPTAKTSGTPDFILAADPDGWLGNYVVAYWKQPWKEIWLGSDDSRGIITELAELGFDGVYLDWVEAYDDERVQKAAQADGVDEAEEMATFVEEIGIAGRKTTPEFLVIAQNATFLIDEFTNTSKYTDIIDALAVEDTWYYGNGASEDWNDGDENKWGYDIQDRLECEQENCSLMIENPDNVCPDDEETEACLDNYPVSGDLHGGGRHVCEEGEEGTSNCWSTENRLEAYDRYLAHGVPVFTVDYCISTDKAAMVYRDARAQGLRPLVTRVQLSRNTETPPGDFE